MPEITEITVSYNRKVQLDNYEPITHLAELTAELYDDEEPGQAYDELREQVEDMVERGIAQRVAQKKMEDGDDDDE